MSSKPRGKKSKKKGKVKEKPEAKEVEYDALATATEEEKNLLPDIKTAVAERMKEDNITLEANGSGVLIVDPNLKLNDFTYLRFLRARKLDVDKATDMLVKTILWRQKYKPYTVDESAAVYFLNLKSVVFNGRDREGDPITWYIVRNLIMENVNKYEDVIKRYVIFCLERSLTSMYVDGHRSCTIFDMKSFGLAHYNPIFTPFIIDCAANYYPELLGHCYLLDAPWIFTPLWAIIRPWIDPITAAKVAFLYRDKLDEKIELAKIPKNVGGTLDEEYDYKAPEGMKIPASPAEVVIPEGAEAIKFTALK